MSNKEYIVGCIHCVGCDKQIQDNKDLVLSTCTDFKLADNWHVIEIYRKQLSFNEKYIKFCNELRNQWAKMKVDLEDEQLKLQTLQAKCDRYERALEEIKMLINPDNSYSDFYTVFDDYESCVEKPYNIVKTALEENKDV